MDTYEIAAHNRKMRTLALDWMRQGIAVFPVGLETNIPLVNWVKFQTRMTTYGELEQWARAGVPFNVGLVCGWRGLIVLEFNSPGAYVEWQTRFTIRSYSVINDHRVQVYFRHPRPVKCYEFPGGTLQGRGGYVLAPGSMDLNGAVYEEIDLERPILDLQALETIGFLHDSGSHPDLVLS